MRHLTPGEIDEARAVAAEPAPKIRTPEGLDATATGLGESVSEKRCRVCGEVKLLTEYHRNRGNRDGRRSMCRTCVAAKDKLRPKRDPAKQRAVN